MRARRDSVASDTCLTSILLATDDHIEHGCSVDQNRSCRAQAQSRRLSLMTRRIMVFDKSTKFRNAANPDDQKPNDMGYLKSR